MKVLVIGAGAVGGYFGGMLVRAGEDVTFVARGEYLDSIKSRGLIIKSYKGELSLKVNVVSDPARLGDVDLILMCVKSYSTEEATTQCLKNIGKNTIILSLQNGVDNADRILRITGKDNVLGGVVFISSELNKWGEILHYYSGKLVIGKRDGKISDRGRKVARMFEKADVPCTISNDIQRDLWRKLVWNAAFNSVSAITKSTMEEMMGCDETRALIRLTMNEVLSIAKGIGHCLDEQVIEEYLDVPERCQKMRTSTLQDLLKGKYLEIDAINGAVIANGRKIGIPTPFNSSLYALLKLINNKH